MSTSNTGTNTTAVNISTGNTTGAVTIGNTGAAMNIRGSAINVTAATTTSSGTITANSYDLSSGATTKSLFTTQTANATLFGNIGSGSYLTIGNQSARVQASQIDISGNEMNNVNNPLGAINIGNLQTDGILNIGTNTSRTAVGTINIGSGAAGTNLSVINLSSSSSGGTINVNRPLTLGYSPSALTNSFQIGFREVKINGVNINTSPTASTITTWVSWTMGIGVWIVETNFYINSGAIDRVQWSITNQVAPNEDLTTRAGANTKTNSACMAQSTCVIQNTVAASTWRINGLSSGVSTHMQGIYVSVTRIA
jgi:hypothetical protein